MGRIEKKFQKKKDREREVRKKILLKRAVSRAQDKEARKQHLLEKEVEKKVRQPFRKSSPELQKALEAVNKLTDDVFKEKDPAVVAEEDDVDSGEVVGFAPEPGK
jgi:hypothetical protein